MGIVCHYPEKGDLRRPPVTLHSRRNYHGRIDILPNLGQVILLNDCEPAADEEKKSWFYGFGLKSWICKETLQVKK